MNVKASFPRYVLKIVSIYYRPLYQSPIFNCQHKSTSTLEKKSLNARGFAREFLRSSMLYKPGKSLKGHGKSSSLHSKKNFCLGVAGFFVSGVISGGLF